MIWIDLLAMAVCFGLTMTSDGLAFWAFYASTLFFAVAVLCDTQEAQEDNYYDD